MNFSVTNKDVQVRDIRILGVSASSVLLVGDTNEVTLSSFFDSFPEAVTEAILPLVPLPSIVS